MLRPVHLVLLLVMVVLIAALEEPLEPTRTEIEPSPNSANDLDADASSWGHARPWRYGGGWRSGWGGRKGGGWGGWGGWGGKAWVGRS